MKTFIIIWILFPFISTDNLLFPYLGQTGTKKEKRFSERDSAIIFLNELKIKKQSYYAPFIENIKFDSIYGNLQPLKNDWNKIAYQASIETQVKFKDQIDTLTCITDNNLLYLIYANNKLEEMKALYNYKPKKQKR